MSRVSSPNVAAHTGSSTRRSPAVHREVAPTTRAKVGDDYAHLSPEDLLGRYWGFAGLALSAVAASLVSLAGADMIEPFIKGDLADAVGEAERLKKARGRSMSPEIVAADLDTVIPAGFTPNFDLYLQAVGIRPETAADRKSANQVRSAIKKKIADVRAGPSPG